MIYTFKISYKYLILFLVVLVGCTSTKKKENVLYTDTFNAGLTNWVVEQMGDGTVEVVNHKMDISQGNGALIWYKEKLYAPVTIEYDITVVDKGGKHDRVADMNCFWMANDPSIENDFFKNGTARGGKFSSYFSHSLYYVGFGGHNNTKTRFRKYLGNGERPLLLEHDLEDSKFLIVPNKKNHIKIVVDKKQTKYFYNDNLVYHIKDENIYQSGYFGIRSFQNHLLVDNFKVTKLE